MYILKHVSWFSRVKHSQPVVVDIIDSHSIFQSQWKKRRAFYMKENYKIIHTTNSKYVKNNNNSSDNEIWETICVPGTNKSKSSFKSPKVDSKDEFLQGQCLIKFKSNS